MAATDKRYFMNVNPAPYSQAVFLTQKIINNSFSLLWQLAQAEPAGDQKNPNKNPLKHFEYRNRAREFLEFDVGKPTVSLQVTTKDPMLYFKLRMTRGNVFLYLTNDPEDDSSIDWVIDNWVFAFSVKIGKTICIQLPNHYYSPSETERKQITKDSQEYKQYKERAGLPNSNFSLASLFIDSSCECSLPKIRPDPE